MEISLLPPSLVSSTSFGGPNLDTDNVSMLTNPLQQLSDSTAVSQPAADRSILSPGSSYFLLQDPAHVPASHVPASMLDHPPTSSGGCVSTPVPPQPRLSGPSTNTSVALVHDAALHAELPGSSATEVSGVLRSPPIHMPAVSPATSPLVAENPVLVDDSDGSASSANATPPPRARTRFQNNIIQPKKLFPGMIRYGNFCATGEPDNFKEALTDSRLTLEAGNG